MKEREKLINMLMEEKGGTREEYLNLLNQIAYHESGHTMDPTIKQIGGGPGRGKYQFEVGKERGGIIAAKRLKNYYKEKNLNVPRWLDNATKDDSLDASKLSSEQQDLLFLGNMRMHPKADFTKVMNGDQSVENFWADNHWAGSKVDRPKRIQSFRESLSDYSPEKIETISQNTPENIPSDYDVELRETAPAVRDNIPSVGDMNGFMQYVKTRNNNPPSVNSKFQDKNLNEFKGGGTHSQNPLGGIPQGNGSNGKPNTVEEDETSFDLPGGKFVFSNRIKI